uniref:Peptidase M13 C-terminal domain-containing protein n=1 Tax=Hyaloperonospora arabidopsidis (strain Emoy2) TaxID=559515 RepID=M4B7F5_HYAAE
MEYSFTQAQNATDTVLEQAFAKNSSSLTGKLYASCMNMDARNAIGAQPLQEGVQSILNASNKRDLFHVAGRLARTGADFITNFSPDSSLPNASHNILWITHADLTLDDEYYRNPRVLEHVGKNMSHYASTILQLTGFHLNNTSEYENYGDVVLNVEKQLIELQLYAQLDPSNSTVYYLFTYEKATEKYPLVFGAYAEGMRLLEDAPALTKDTQVALQSLAYLEKAEEFVSLISLDALKVYVAFIYIDSLAPYLSAPFIDARFQFFRQVMLGVEISLPLERKCAAAVIKLLPVHAGAEYVAHREDMKETGDRFIAMLDEILSAMNSSIRTLEWLDETTRNSALSKLGTLEVMYIQPDAVQLEKEAKGLAELDNTAYFANVNLIHSAQYVALTLDIEASVDRSDWGMSAASANAYYSPRKNQIVFPAGLMQRPFFESDGRAAQLFGSLGTVAGHEISHGFDNSGSKFDAKGNYNVWWTNVTAKAFETRSQCLIDEYNQFSVEGEGGVKLVPVNGKKTLGENIADNGGLRVAFNAYKKHEASNRSGQNSTDDQLFFLSFAQTWCGKVREKTAVNSFLTNVHAGNEVRVNGAVMNSAAFAEAFHCPASAPMNPVNKCVLW